MFNSPQSWASLLAQQPLMPVFTQAERLITSNQQVNSAAVEQLATSLQTAGFTQLEITLRNPAAWQVLAELAANPKTANITLIAGSVRRLDQLEKLVKLGVQWAVSPGWNSQLSQAAQEAGIKLLAGVATAGEAMQAAELGMQEVKFFPAESLGASYLQNLAAAIPELKFVPTGGIRPANLAAWLQMPQVLAVGGSWLFNHSDFASLNWTGFTQQAKEAFNLANDIKTQV